MLSVFRFRRSPLAERPLSTSEGAPAMTDAGQRMWRSTRKRQKFRDSSRETRNQTSGGGGVTILTTTIYPQTGTKQLRKQGGPPNRDGNVSNPAVSLVLPHNSPGTIVRHRAAMNGWGGSEEDMRPLGVTRCHWRTPLDMTDSGQGISGSAVYQHSPS